MWPPNRRKANTNIYFQLTLELANWFKIVATINTSVSLNKRNTLHPFVSTSADAVYTKKIK